MSASAVRSLVYFFFVCAFGESDRSLESTKESALSETFFALNVFDKQGEVPETGVQGFVIFM